MMMAYTPMLAHDPEMIMGLFVGALLLVALLHALWYWFVSQVGFMLASIGTRVERMSKIMLPLVLVPVSGMCTLGVFVFALLAGSGEEPTLWCVLVGLLLLLFLRLLCFVLGFLSSLMLPLCDLSIMSLCLAQGGCFQATSDTGTPGYAGPDVLGKS